MTGNNSITNKTIAIEKVPIDDYLKAQELKALYGCKTWLEYLQLSNIKMEEGLDQ